MNQQEIHELTDASEHTVPHVWQRYRFVVLICCVVLVTLMMVAVSLHLYVTNGTAQLDLSRPGYQSVRTQAKSNESFEQFSDSGAINDSTLDTFKKSYETYTKQATSVDAFTSDVLSDQTLGIDDPSVQ